MFVYMRHLMNYQHNKTKLHNIPLLLKLTVLTYINSRTTKLN